MDHFRSKLFPTSSHTGKEQEAVVKVTLYVTKPPEIKVKAFFPTIRLATATSNYVHCGCCSKQSFS